jgi:hypothetical protein
MGVKNTHRMRNTISIVAMPATQFVSAAGLKRDMSWICPTCGSSVHRHWTRGGDRPYEQEITAGGPITAPLASSVGVGQTPATARTALVEYDLHNWSPEHVENALAQVKYWRIPYRFDAPSQVLTVPATYEEAMNKFVLGDAAHSVGPPT